jgi:hypothetical protein
MGPFWGLRRWGLADGAPRRGGLCGASGSTARVGGAYTPSSRANYQRGRARPAVHGSRPSPSQLPRAQVRPAHKSAQVQPRRRRESVAQHTARPRRGCRRRPARARVQTGGCSPATARQRVRTRPSPERPDQSPGADAMDTAHACCSSWRPGRAHCAAGRAAARTFRGCSQPNGPAHGRHGRARAAAWREIEAAELAVAVYARGMGRAAA